MTIKVGIPVSLTGQFSLQGAQTLAGITAWVEDVNRHGGLVFGSGQSPVELVWRDDSSRRDKAEAITRDLIVGEQVDLLIGPYSAVLTNAAAEAARVGDRLLWNQGGASPVVYRQGNPWVVGVLTPADEYLTGLLPAVREARPGRRIRRHPASRHRRLPTRRCLRRRTGSGGSGIRDRSVSTVRL